MSADHEQTDVLPLQKLVPHNGMTRSTAPIEPWIDVSDLAFVLGVSTDWVYEKAASGEQPSYKFGGHRRFRVSEVENWASKCTSEQISRIGDDETRRR